MEKPFGENKRNRACIGRVRRWQTMKRFFAAVSAIAVICTCAVHAADFLQPSVNISGDYSAITVNGTVPEGCSEINLLLLLPGLIFLPQEAAM